MTDIEKIESLLPCPFCGSAARAISHGYWPAESNTGCSNTECPVYPNVSTVAPAIPREDGQSFSVDFDKSDAELIKLWNTRHESALAAKVKAQAEVIRDLREGLEHYADKENWGELIDEEGQFTGVDGWYLASNADGYDKAAEILDRTKGEM